MSLLTTLIGIQRQKEISDLQEKLSRATHILHTKNDIETLDFALAKVIEDFEQKAARENEPEEIDIDVHTLNRITPKQTYRVTAKVRFGGRGKPLKYDLSGYNFNEEDE